MSTVTNFMLDLLKLSNFATGADFSKWKGNWVPKPEMLNLMRLVLDFIIFRVGYGAQDGKVYEDPVFRRNYAIAQKFFPAALKGGYWYFSSVAPWRLQLDMFISIISDFGLQFLVLDFEAGYNTKSFAFAQNGVFFMDELQRRFPNLKIFIYSNRYTYDDWMARYTDGYNKYPYWIAQYPWKDWLNTFTEWFKTFWQEVILKGVRTPTLPKARKDWELWQFIAASGIGNELGFDSDELDFNISRLPKEEFIKFILGDQEEEPGPTPGPFPVDDTYVKERLGQYRENLEAFQGNLEQTLLEFDDLFTSFDNLMTDVFPEDG